MLHSTDRAMQLHRKSYLWGVQLRRVGNIVFRSVAIVSVRIGCTALRSAWLRGAHLCCWPLHLLPFVYSEYTL